MTEIELIIDLYKHTVRQGPGSATETKKALNLIGIGKTDNIRIADIGCGTGAQTIDLAENTNGHITAVDIFPEFLDALKKKAEERGYDNRIETVSESMDNLNFSQEEFDLMWSEGAIYNMGFKEGVREWRKFIKTGGFLAVTEISWISHSRPREIENHWNTEYPQIDTIANKTAVLEENGYTPYAHFIIPPYCWIENFYKPLQACFDSFINRNADSELAQKIIENEKKEIALYNKYNAYYGYVFYIAQKR